MAYTPGDYTLSLPVNLYNVYARLDNYSIQGPFGPNWAYAVAVQDIIGVDFEAIDVSADAFEPDDNPGEATRGGGSPADVKG